MSSSRQADKLVLAEFSRRLLHRRLERNLTQAALGREAGVSKRTIERIESGGSTQLSTLIRILRALGLLDRLESLIPAPPPSPIEQLDTKTPERQRASGSRARTESSRTAGRGVTKYDYRRRQAVGDADRCRFDRAEP